MHAEAARDWQRCGLKGILHNPPWYYARICIETSLAHPIYHCSIALWSCTRKDWSNSWSVLELPVPLASYPGSLGEGEKRAWYLLFAHALNYSTFQSFWISPGTSVLFDVTIQLAERNGSFVLRSWTSRLCFCDLKDEQTACVKAIYEGKDVFFWLPTGFGKSMCYEVLPFVFWQARKRDRPTGYWSLTKTKQERIHVERGSFTTICTYVALRYLGLLLYVIVAPPILRLRKNSNSRVVQILIKRMRKQ